MNNPNQDPTLAKTLVSEIKSRLEENINRSKPIDYQIRSTVEKEKVTSHKCSPNSSASSSSTQEDYVFGYSPTVSSTNGHRSVTVYICPSCQSEVVKKVPSNVSKCSNSECQASRKWAKLHHPTLTVGSKSCLKPSIQRQPLLNPCSTTFLQPDFQSLPMYTPSECLANFAIRKHNNWDYFNNLSAYATLPYFWDLKRYERRKRKRMKQKESLLIILTFVFGLIIFFALTYFGNTLVLKIIKLSDP